MLLARGNVLESEIQSQTSVFNSILTRIQEADINSQAVESEMDISSLAQLPGVPVSPVANKVLAGMNVNIWDAGDAIKELVASSRPVDPERLADPEIPLAEVSA